MSSRVATLAASLGRAALVVVSAVLVAPLGPSRANACSIADCVETLVVPGPGAVVPANLPGLRIVLGDEPDAPVDYWSSELEPDRWTFRVEAVDGDVVPLRRAGSDLLFETPLRPDGEYVVHVDSDLICSPSSSHRFTTVAPAPLPSALGRVVPGDLREGRSSGECTEEGRWLQRDVHLRLDPTAEPWADALEVRFSVAGERAPRSDFADRFASDYESRDGPFTRSLLVECPDTINYNIGADTRVPGGIQPTAAVGRIAGAWTATTAVANVDYDCEHRGGGCRGVRVEGLVPLLLTLLWGFAIRRRVR